MSFARRLLIVLLCCGLVAWLAGPAGRLLVVFGALLFVPGYVIERALPAAAAARPPAAFVRPALWLGLSISALALLYEWATAVGLVLSVPVLAGLLTGVSVVAVAFVWRDTRAVPAAAPPGPPEPSETPGAVPAHLRQYGPWYALLAVFGGSLVVRFIQIETLVLPAWVDSVHHALLIRVAAEQGQAPYSLRPYLPVDNLPYHWGYHVLIAATRQLSNIELSQVMLWTGQVLNALHVLTCAALASFFWRRPMAGIGAGIVVGLLSIMPAYYVSWGRYTQLTGLLLLPPLAIAWYSGLRAPSRRWLVINTLLLAGLMLTHMRVLIFALALLAIISLVWALRQPWPALRQRVLWGLLCGGLALLLNGFWLSTVVARIVLPAVEQPQDLLSEASYNAFSESLLWSGYTRALAAAALLAAFWSVARRQAAPLIVLGWVAALLVLSNPSLLSYVLPMVGAALLLFASAQRHYLLLLPAGALLLVNPWLVQLPTFWLINNESVIISMFLPISLLIGGGVALLWDWLALRPPLPWRTVLQGGYLLGLLALAVWGGWVNRTVINPVTVIATPADRAALAWIADNTPEDARFLINAEPWLPISDRGADGGWWLLPLTGRWSSTPPVLYAYGAPEYVQQARTHSQFVANFYEGQQGQLYQLIDELDITHIYMRAGVGKLKPASFAASDSFETVYQQDGVTIMRVQQPFEP
jgi:hypothetical protein